MSASSQEPGRMRRWPAGSRWRDSRSAAPSVKAAYARPQSDAKRMDPDVRERIGRANMTRPTCSRWRPGHIPAGSAGGEPRLWQAATSGRRQVAAPTERADDNR